MATRQISRKEILQELLPNLVCFKCKEPPTGLNPNRYKCMNNSHSLCENCKERCDCGSNATKTPCGLTAQLLKTLPSFCSYYKNGCKVA